MSKEKRTMDVLAANLAEFKKARAEQGRELSGIGEDYCDAFIKAAEGEGKVTDLEAGDFFRVLVLEEQVRVSNASFIWKTCMEIVDGSAA